MSQNANKSEQKCKFYEANKCNRGDSCNFSHIKSDISHENAKSNIICKFFRKGKCSKGSSCEFRHSKADTHIIVNGTDSKKIKDITVAEVEEFCKKGDADNIQKILLWSKNQNNPAIEDKFEWDEKLLIVCENNHLCINCPAPDALPIYHDCPYIKIAKMILSDDPGSDYYINDALDVACKTGFVEMVNLLVDRSEFYANRGLINACEGGHVGIAKLMITRGAACFNNGLAYACFEGHIPMINLMIEHGANDWNESLIKACDGGKMNIVEMMIANGATKFNDGLMHACSAGYIDIASKMVSCGAYDMNKAMLCACNKGHIDIVKMMISFGANSWNRCLENASNKGYLELVDLMISYGANNFKLALLNATFNNSENYNMAIVKMLILKGAPGIEKYYLYNVNKSQIMYLLENGVSMEKLIKIPGINILVEKISLYKKTFRGAMTECYVINDLIGLIEEYLVL